MDVTVANVRQEYAVERAPWALVPLAGLAFLVGVEVARQLRLRDQPMWLSLLACLAIIAIGLRVAHGLAVIARRATFGDELWRKFGLNRVLLDAVAQLDDLSPETGATVDRLLHHTRTIAALANHEPADWDGPNLAEVAAQVESVVAAALADEPLADPEPLERLADEVAEVAMNLTELLAAVRREEEAGRQTASEALSSALAAVCARPRAVLAEPRG